MELLKTALAISSSSTSKLSELKDITSDNLSNGSLKAPFNGNVSWEYVSHSYVVSVPFREITPSETSISSESYSNKDKLEVSNPS